MEAGTGRARSALVWVAVLVLSTLAMVMYATVSWLESVLRKGVRQ